MNSTGDTRRAGLQRFSQLLDTASHERRSARATINCLRQGSPPREGVERITVDLSSVRAVFTRKLQVAQSGGCSFTLVNGVYGSGKSHSLCLLREMALEQNFLVSFITISPRECPLYDLGAVYAKIARNIEGRSGTGVISLQDVLDSWAETVRTTGGSSLEHSRIAIRSLHPDFRMVLAEYFSPRPSDRVELVARWLLGDDSTKRTAHVLNVQLRATNEYALLMLNELGNLCRTIGFRGLVILLDEAESIPSYTGSSRQQQCYENLSRLIEGSDRVPHCYFVYATTPFFFQKCGGRVPVSEFSEVVLQPPCLSEADFTLLGNIVRDLYIIGEAWQGWHSYIDNYQIDRCVDKYIMLNRSAVRPRGFVRSLISALDICANNPKKKLFQVFSPIADEH